MADALATLRAPNPGGVTTAGDVSGVNDGAAPGTRQRQPSVAHGTSPAPLTRSTPLSASHRAAA